MSQCAKLTLFYMTSWLKCVNLTLCKYVPTLCGASIALFKNKDSTYVTYRRIQIGVQCKKRLEFLNVVDSTLYAKVAYFVFKDSSFNPLSPDLLPLYRRLNPIKIWPTYAVPPTITLYPRSTYDLWRAGSSPAIFQPVEKLIPLTTTSQSGPDQSPLYFRPTYALPDQGPLIADPSIFLERERAGVDRVSGVNGP